MSFQYSIKYIDDLLSQDDRKNARKMIRNMNQFTCHFCNITFQAKCKLEYFIKQNDELIPCCQLCHGMVNNMPKHSKLFVVCSSSKEQIEIIREFHNYVRINKRIPSHTDIDPNSSLAKTKPRKFIQDMLDNNDNQHEFKLFPTDKVNIDYILAEKKEYDDPFQEYLDEMNNKTEQIDTVKLTMDRIVRWNQKIIENLTCCS